jgi:hypothetical protein
MSNPFDRAPEDLHELNYARKILDECGMPAKGNLELVADCITAIRAKLKCPAVEAARWLWRRVKRAQQLDMRINGHWFRDGEYNNVPMKDPEQTPAYVPIDREAVDKEQSTPGWQAASAELRAMFAKVAGKTVVP